MPKWFDLAKKYIGTTEIPGAKHNPLILEWFEKSGHGWIKDDETAWCAAFANAMLEESGYKGTNSVAARSFMQWGVEVKRPKVGDIVVFWRGSKSGWQGHVGFYVSEDSTGIWVLGGNQKNAVNVQKYSKEQLLGYRRPATMGNSNAVAGIGMSGGVGGAVLMIEPIQETVSVIEGQKESLTNGDYIAFVIAAIVILGTLIALYAKWQDARGNRTRSTA